MYRTAKALYTYKTAKMETARKEKISETKVSFKGIPASRFEGIPANIGRWGDFSR